MPFDHIYAFLSVFYHSAIIGTENRHVPIVVIVIKSIKTGLFRFFLRKFLTCRTVFTKISKRNMFYVGNLPKTGQNSLICLNEKLTSNQAHSSGCRLMTGVMQYFSQ